MSEIRRRALTLIGSVVVGLVPATAPVAAQGVVGSALGDIIIGAIQELLRILFSPIRAVIESHGDAILRTVVGTPHPDAVFGAPSNGPWPRIYDFYWETMIPLTLTLYGLAIGIVIFLESTSHLFSSYHHSKLKRRAFSGLIGILSWWWIAAISLRFMDALAGFLVPPVSDITLFETLSFSTMGVLGTVVALSANFVLFVLIGLIYLARHLALYLFVFLMPLLIVFWILGVGPFTLASRFMRKLAGFYVPFLFMTVPVALLFRLGDLLGNSFGPSSGEFGAWLTALVIPLVAVASPFILFWQAGAVFFIAAKAARHVSAQKAGRRLSSGQEHLQTTKQSGKNFLRGMRDEPAVKRDGQYVLDASDSRAHASGQRLNTTGSRLREAITGGGRSGGDSGGSSAESSVSPDSSPGGESSDDSGGKEFDRDDAFRDPQSPTESGDSRNEPPRYIQ